MQVLIGLSAYYHDSAVAIFVDGELKFAAHEERYSRLKHDSAFPTNALKAGLNELGIKPDDVNGFIFYEKPLRKFDRIFETIIANWPLGFDQFKVALKEWFGGKLNHRKKISKELEKGGFKSPNKIPIHFSEHHLSHCALAAVGSNFDKSAILVLDAVGEWESGTVWDYSKNDSEASLAKLKAMYFPHSIGMLYSALTAYLGFRVNSGEYKVMGLAPYGSPIYADKIKEHLLLDQGRNFALNLKAFKFQTKMWMFDEKLFSETFGITSRKEDQPILQVHCDIASSLQKILNETVSDIVDFAIELTGHQNVCIAGGVALNCVTNSYILANNKNIRNLYIHPASGDAGGAAGAATAFLLMQDKSIAKIPTSPFLGSDYPYDREKISALLLNENVEIRTFKFNDLCEKVANALSRGKIVGWHRGRSEFGPRALGNRSIFASPLIKDAQTKVNLKIKYREGFRPFAPIVISDRFSDFFSGSGDYRFMLQTAQVKSFSTIEPSKGAVNDLSHRLASVNSNLPAITHVDGSARVQTINRNSDVGQLLSNFEEVTGFPVLVNTSFNIRGEPPVETPYDAIKCFLSCEMDILVLGDIVIRKKGKSNRSLYVNYGAD